MRAGPSWSNEKGMDLASTMLLIKRIPCGHVSARTASRSSASSDSWCVPVPVRRWHDDRQVPPRRSLIGRSAASRLTTSYHAPNCPVLEPQISRIKKASRIMAMDGKFVHWDNAHRKVHSGRYKDDEPFYVMAEQQARSLRLWQRLVKPVTLFYIAARTLGLRRGRAECRMPNRSSLSIPPLKECSACAHF